MYDYDLTNYGVYGNDYASLLTGLGVFLLVILAILVAVVVLLIVAEWKIYKKAGKGGWECIVPFYNNWVLVEIAGLNWWWFLLLIAGTALSFLGFDNNSSLESIASLAFLFGFFVCNYNLAKKFHKDTGFAVLMTIFPVIVYPIIAFGKSYQYDSSVSVSKNGPFGAVESSNDNVTTNSVNDVNSNIDNQINELNNDNTSVTENGLDSSANVMSFCPNCGSRIESGSKYCGNCGKEL